MTVHWIVAFVAGWIVGFALVYHALGLWHRYRMWRLQRDIQACVREIRRSRLELDRVMRDIPPATFRAGSRRLELMDNERWSKAV